MSNHDFNEKRNGKKTERNTPRQAKKTTLTPKHGGHIFFNTK